MAYWCHDCNTVFPNHSLSRASLQMQDVASSTNEARVAPTVFNVQVLWSMGLRIYHMLVCCVCRGTYTTGIFKCETCLWWLFLLYFVEPLLQSQNVELTIGFFLKLYLKLLCNLLFKKLMIAIMILEIEQGDNLTNFSTFGNF